MAIDVYLQLDGIKGESQDSRYKDWIKCSQVHFGAHSPIPAAALRDISRDLMEEIGSRTLSSATSGRVQAIAAISPVMSSTALNRRLLALALASSAASITVAAELPQPRFLQEPILGLRYEPGKIKFEPFPVAELAKCTELMHDDATMHSHFWIFAVAQDAGRTYYIVGGCYARRQPGAGERNIELDEPGIALNIDGGRCEVFGQARELFELPEQTPEPVRKQLALDAEARLNRAFGGTEKLSKELRRQRIDPAPLPPDLHATFQSYFGA